MKLNQPRLTAFALENSWAKDLVTLVYSCFVDFFLEVFEFWRGFQMSKDRRELLTMA